MVRVVERTHGTQTAWESWATWRQGQSRPEQVWFFPAYVPVVAQSASWCPTCMGNGRIYGFAANGEGLIPTHPCGHCAGSGRVGGFIACG